MAEVVVPVAIFDTILYVNFADDGDLVAGLMEEVSKENDVRRQSARWPSPRK